MCEGLTISRLALNKFISHYLDANNCEIPKINEFEYFNFIYYLKF